MLPALPKYRPALTALEDRNAPGDILSGVLAAAIGGALLNPLGQVAAWVGESSAGSLPLPNDRPSVISVGAGVRPAQDNVPFPRIDLARPELDAVAVAPATSTVGVVPTNLDDQFLFAPAQPTALPRFDATTPVNAVASSGGDAATAAASVSSATQSGNSGGVVGIAGTDNGSPAFILRPTARSVPAASNQTGNIAVTAPTVETPAVAPTETVRLGGGSQLTSNFEYIADLPLNTAPVANDDTATVDEDTSVIIDVLVNDTDADADDIRIDTWVWQPAHGTVTQEPGGKLKYTPFPDFSGSYVNPYAYDTFTYSVTDGRDVSNTATVIVTVNSVNDTPRAFNDAFPFYHSRSFDPNVPTVTYGSIDSAALLGNDSDIEGPLSRVVSVVPADDFPGTLTMNAEGFLTWIGPEEWYGTTSFKYTAADSTAGGPELVSNWATVHLWALDYPPTFGDLAAQDDLFAIGEEAQAFNVTTNDTDAAFAVLAAPPPAKQILDFGFDGTVSYAPPSIGDLTLIYRVFNAGGAASALTTVQMPKVDLEIFNGQDGAAVREQNDDETKIGAFTVVNWNDTDGDTVKDFEDKDGVLARHGVGVDEMDLMGLRVHNPAGFGKNGADTITVDIKDGDAELFATSKRETPLGKKITLSPASFNNPVVGQPQLKFLDFWVESNAPNTNLRTIKIEMDAKLGGVVAIDNVAATGVWAALEGRPNPDGFHISEKQTQVSADADDNPYGANFENLSGTWDAKAKTFVPTPGFSLGKPGMFVVTEVEGSKKTGYSVTHHTVHLRNAVEMEFYVTPTGIEKEPGIRFDVSRTIEFQAWAQEVGGAFTKQKERVFPSWRERANDDGGKTDEDNTPNNTHIYSSDFPGWFLSVSKTDYAANKLNFSMTLGKAYERFAQRMNAAEFVRVRVDGNAFDHDPDLPGTATTLEKANAISHQKSRASAFTDWHSWSDFTWDGAQSKWVRTSDPAAPPVGAGKMPSRNSIGQDHYLLNTPDQL